MSEKGANSSRFRRSREAASPKAERYERPITLPALDSSWKGDFTWNGLERLAWFIEELEKAAQREQSVRLDFGRVTSISPLTIVLVAGAIRRFEHDRGGGSVRLDVNSMTKDVRNVLQWAGFLKAFRLGGQPLLGRYLPLREDRSRDMNGILDYVFHSPWMGSDWISRDANLQQEILTAVSENLFQCVRPCSVPDRCFGLRRIRPDCHTTSTISSRLRQRDPRRCSNGCWYQYVDARSHGMGLYERKHDRYSEVCPRRWVQSTPKIR